MWTVTFDQLDIQCIIVNKNFQVLFYVSLQWTYVKEIPDTGD